MAIAITATPQQPMADLNTTPLIDVMLVLLVMMILSIPLANHAATVALPSPSDTIGRQLIQPDRNKVSITPLGTITFNGTAVSREELQALLQASLAMRPEPELQFQPDPAAPYDVAAKVINQIRGSGISAFGFVGNEQYQSFGKAPPVAPKPR